MGSKGMWLDFGKDGRDAYNFTTMKSENKE